MQSKEQNKRPKKGQKNNGPKIKPIDNNGSIAIKFTIDGQLDKFNPIHRGKFDNEMVLARARQICQQIELDLIIGQFDPTLDKYRPIKAIKTIPNDSGDNFQQVYNVFELYLEYLANNSPERERYNTNIKLTKNALAKIKPTLYQTSLAYDMLEKLKERAIRGDENGHKALIMSP